jgi:hypothetical protein
MTGNHRNGSKSLGLESNQVFPGYGRRVIMTVLTEFNFLEYLLFSVSRANMRNIQD